MSRRSLRLHTTTGLYGDDSLDPSLNHNVYHSASFSAGGASRRESKGLKSRRSQQQEVSCSQSLLLTTPRKRQQGSQQHNRSVAANDPSLLSSMLDESCIQERTLVGSFWGLDEAVEVKERTMTVDHSMCGTNGDVNSAQTQTSMVNGSFCKDFNIHSDRHEALGTYSSSSTGARSATSNQALTATTTSPPSTVYARDKSRKHKTAHSSYCGTLHVKELGTDGKHMNLNGSLCDDCKGKRHAVTHATYTSSWASRSHHVLGALWLATAYTGSSMLWVGQEAGSAVWAVTRRMLSVLWLADRSPGKAATGVFWWLGTGWYHLVTLLSLLNVFVLTRCPLKLLKLLLILLPFLILLALWHWGPSSLMSVLPVVNITEWSTAYPLSFTSAQAQTKDRQSTMTPLPPAVSQPGSVSVDSERLVQLEQRLAQLWEKVEGGDQSQEQQHREMLGLYHSLREQLDTQTDRDGMGLWVSGLLEKRLTLLKRDMETDAALQREQSQEQDVVQQQGQESRLAQLEVLLQTLAAKTEEVQRRQVETASAPPVPIPISVPVPVSESHDVLLAEVQRLEAALGSIRQDLQGVMGCQGMCDRLDTLHETVSEQVSAQVRRELQALFYGSEQAGDSEPGEKELPESLLQWLSERYVSGADLQASLASLELSILQNVSLQLEESRARQETLSTETVSQTVMHTVGAGMSEEHVQLMVKNALKLYSQDRTGLVDYALESGGGNILGTRCSETYETKTALMSLFGLPLWYFSQSPRVVIQPDVHPGNCWAFHGSYGYVVIRLSMRIVPSAFSLEHIPKDLSPTGNIDSAPRQFNVYGLDDESQEEGKLLGSYTYQEDGEALQTYPVTEENDKAYQIIEVRVLSNWGHTEYTCLYRIRVHGQLRIN
ncbi:SUN domain-containing protein 1 isoform X2 [Coregonus clupeaformis]|uniref:SUN domain-containing protein 1 isoform X2 n=1 Tax=Coregonus clupeaformis TaxID=59861 RepID=UPI001E1C2B4D|nr:SUN domain-containing protein 1 isoform X2 [Coregonus clupeaformis]